MPDDEVLESEVLTKPVVKSFVPSSTSLLGWVLFKNELWAIVDSIDLGINVLLLLYIKL